MQTHGQMSLFGQLRKCTCGFHAPKVTLVSSRLKQCVFICLCVCACISVQMLIMINLFCNEPTANRSECCSGAHAATTCSSGSDPEHHFSGWSATAYHGSAESSCGSSPHHCRTKCCCGTGSGSRRTEAATIIEFGNGIWTFRHS